MSSLLDRRYVEVYGLGLSRINPGATSQLAIAYEPPWEIGGGQNAKPKEMSHTLK